VGASNAFVNGVFERHFKFFTHSCCVVTGRLVVPMQMQTGVLGNKGALGYRYHIRSQMG
jgi:hypothetical protein